MSDYDIIDEKSYDAEVIREYKETLKGVKDSATEYLDRIEKGDDFSGDDVSDIADMKEKLEKQTNSVRDIVRKTPLLGDLIEIAKDLTVILNRALKLMIENIKAFSVSKEKPVVEHVNEEGIKLSDSISATIHATEKNTETKQRETTSLSNENEKLAARSNYFGYEEEKPKEENSAEKPQEDISKDKDAEMQAKLDAYNKNVKERGEKKKAEEESSMSSEGAALQPSKDDD